MNVLTFGETMALIRATDTGPLPTVQNLNLGIGGTESNAAIALRRLDVPVTWIGRVGQDSVGDLVVREITAEGVHVVGIRDPDAPTGLMIKERRTTTATRVWYYRGGSAGSHLQPHDISDDAIAAASLLHVTGITPALSSSAADATQSAMRRARQHGVPVSFDLNYRAALWTPEEAAQSYRTLIPLADMVFGGEEEAALAVDAPNPDELAKNLHALGPSQAVIKQGPNGCTALIDGAEHHHTAVPIEAVDTVGAGDAFVAGYIAEYLHGRSPTQRLTTAITMGAFACLTPGDWEGMPRRTDLGLLSAHEPVTR